MIAVIFELEPREGRTAGYFELAASLRPTPQAVDGFISVERFESLSTPGRYLSLSFWRDEEAVRNWRCIGMHRDAQQQGRAQILAGYRLPATGYRLPAARGGGDARLRLARTRASAARFASSVVINAAVPHQRPCAQAARAARR